MYRVEVEKGNLNFSAAHFIAFGGKCERLHGHNYAVSVILDGKLTEDGYVFDFVFLKEIVREICAQLDHRFLLPSQSGQLTIEKNDREWLIKFENRRYVFPKEDVLALPLDSITAERLAEYFCGQILIRLRKQHEEEHISSISVGIEESPGQTAFYHSSF
jgi:6-pyruvoyltetrahydropterin/6-carboxytetrahydropterin synthase